MPLSKTYILLLLGPVFAAFPAAAEKKPTPKLMIPVACDYGADCWVVNYVDVDSSDKVSDFKCGGKTYDGHKGTDFALGSVAQMKRGVDVLAAADGKVLRLRDGRVDSLKTEDEHAQMREGKKECGNGVLIDHGHGLNTIYCHLKKDSIAVKLKQDVKAGQKIGQIGLSGVTEFPHLHMGVHWEGSVVDPFTGMTNMDGCGAMKASMWHQGLPVTYEPVVIFDGGFKSGSPDFEAIARGEENPPKLGLSSAGFVFWTGFYNVEQGDVVEMTITDPNGDVFVARRDVVPQTRARQYYFTGRKIGRVQLMAGTYIGHTRITRGDIVRDKRFSVAVE